MNCYDLRHVAAEYLSGSAFWPVAPKCILSLPVTLGVHFLLILPLDTQLTVAIIALDKPWPACAVRVCKGHSVKMLAVSMLGLRQMRDEHHEYVYKATTSPSAKGNIDRAESWCTLHSCLGASLQRSIKQFTRSMCHDNIQETG